MRLGTGYSFRTSQSTMIVSAKCPQCGLRHAAMGDSKNLTETFCSEGCKVQYGKYLVKFFRFWRKNNNIKMSKGYVTRFNKFLRQGQLPLQLAHELQHCDYLGR